MSERHETIRFLIMWTGLTIISVFGTFACRDLLRAEVSTREANKYHKQ